MFPPQAGTPSPGSPAFNLDAALSTAFQSGKAPTVANGDPYQNKEKLLKLARQCRDACIDNERWVYERVWWRNILYMLGRQWIYFDGNRNQWRDKRLQTWVPRPVTNKTAETIDAILSVSSSVQLGVTCAPMSPNSLDESTAATLNTLAPAFHLEHNMDEVMWEHDWWLFVTGNAFLHTWWDPSQDRGSVVVTFERCAMCGVVSHPREIVASNQKCPKCGCPSLMPARDAGGSLVQEKATFGQGVTDALSPLEVAVPTPYGNLSEMDFIIRKRWRLKSWYAKHAPQLVDKIQWEQMPTDRSLQLLRGISTATEIGPTPAAFGGSGSGTTSEPGVTEYELYYKPTPEWEKGVLLRFIDGGGPIELVELPEENIPGPLPFETPDGKKIITFTHTRYEKVGGRFWAKSPIDRLIQKQDQINQLDSMIQMIIQRTAAPVWSVAKGAQIKKFSGEPGFVMEHTPSATGDTRPQRIDGANVPGSLFRIREMYLQDFEALAGTYDILKGSKPAGLEAFSALQLMVERSQSRFGPMLAARGRTYREWFSQVVEINRQFGPEERIWQALGPNQQWTYQKFQHAQLQGNVRIMVEDGSQIPKTSLGKRAAIQQLQTMGVINPAQPEVAFRIAKVFGQSDLLPAIDAQVGFALRIQNEFEEWAIQAQMMPGQPTVDPMSGTMVAGMPQVVPPPPGKRLPWMNADVFVAEHTKWACSDRVTDLIKQKPWLESMVAWLIGQHEVARVQAQSAAGPPAGGKPGPPKRPGGQGEAMTNSNRESGNIGDVPGGPNGATAPPV
jgi:hypothetical protein